jgi:glycosyltransferase involved in cell wall biosynthesis
VRILLISPYYFPNINPRAHRWTSIAEEWAKNGHEIHVICSKRNDFPKTSILNGVNIHRTGYNSLKEVFYNFFRVKKRRGEPQINNPKPLKRSRLMTLLVWFNEVFWKKIYFPDDACVWYFPARRKAIQLLNQYPFDALISISLPFTTHLVGLHCKNKFPELQWLIDNGDPFSLQFNHPLNNHFLYKRLNIRLEKKIFERADSISVTTEGTKKLYGKYFPEVEQKITVIPPLLKQGFKKNPEFHLNLDTSKIHIGYFGSFFKKVREPDSFLELLRRIFKEYPEFKTRIAVHFFGEVFEHFLKTFEKYDDLKENIHLHGLISRDDVPEAMSKMNFLLNISNNSDFQLPSKSVDYMATGKPIVNIHSIENDMFKMFCEAYPTILNLKISNSTRLTEHTQGFVNFIKKIGIKKIGRKEMEGLLKEFRQENIASNYLNLLMERD